MSSGGNGKLNDKQKAFVAWYVKLLNGTRAAERAGYEGDMATLAVKGSNLLRNAKVRAVIDAQLKASIPSADEVLTRIGQRAHVDVTPYLDEDQKLDVKKLAADGLGHLVVGVKPGRQGPEITLASAETASKMLARYHKVLGSDAAIDVNASVTLDPDLLTSLTDQIVAAQAQMPEDVEQDDTE